MTSRRKDPADRPRSGEEELPQDEGLSDDVVLREAIARLMMDESDSPAMDASQRQARVDELRAKIEGGEYMSDAKISDIVDRLLRKWKL